MIILGNAPVLSESGEAFIEGIPLTEARGVYGGNDSHDNSGILKYVSIRHGGTNLGEGNEINGLTLGGVGDNRQLSYIEVIANADDGFEFFGATVNGHHLIASYCDDDAFDFDMGYSGKVQFLYAIQSSYRGDNLCEHDGFVQNNKPLIANATLIDRGTSGDEVLISFRNQSAAHYYNCIFVNQANGILVDNNGVFQSASVQWLEEDTQIRSNIFYHIGGNQNLMKLKVMQDKTIDDTLTQGVINQNLFINPDIGLTGGIYHPVTDAGVHVNTIAAEDSIEPVNYRGAFLEKDWTQGWSLTSKITYE